MTFSDAEFLVGYEIEAFWPRKLSKKLAEIYDWDNAGRFEWQANSAAIEVRELLAKFITKSSTTNLKNINGIEFTGKVDESIGLLSGYLPMELVTEPLPAPVAEKLLLDICTWMRRAGVKTKESCGLHINIGLVDRTRAQAVDYLRLLNLADQQKVLETFNRVNNRHCLPSEDLIENDALAIGLEAAENSLTAYWERRHKIERELGVSIAYGVQAAVKCARTRLLESGFENYKPDSAAGKRIVHDLKWLDQQGAYLKRILKFKNKEHTIVDRNSKDGRYFEFRMTGNKDYHLRGPELVKISHKYQKDIRESMVLGPNMNTKGGECLSKPRP